MVKKSDEQNAKMLPDLCYSILPTSGNLIIIKLNESGYYPCDYSTADTEANRSLADELNRRMGITKAQEAAMLHGSMFGWHVPAADTSHYDENGEPIKKQPEPTSAERLESPAEGRRSMQKEPFINAVRSLLPNCTNEALSIWIEFAGECVDNGQYVDFIPEADRTAAIEKWLGSIYAGLYGVKREFGESIASQICNLSLISCLYPGEMKSAAAYLQRGVDIKEVTGLINSGALEGESPFYPRLEDVEFEDEYDDEI